MSRTVDAEESFGIFNRMPRPKSDLRLINLRVSPKEFEALRWFAQQQSRSMTDVIRDYLRLLVKRKEAAAKKVI